jgi:hypothetical protein
MAVSACKGVLNEDFSNKAPDINSIDRSARNNRPETRLLKPDETYQENITRNRRR